MKNQVLRYVAIAFFGFASLVAGWVLAVGVAVNPDGITFPDGSTQTVAFTEGSASSQIPYHSRDVTNTQFIVGDNLLVTEMSAVPAGQRLVVQHASVRVSTDDATLDADCSLRSSDGGVTPFPPDHELMLGPKFSIYLAGLSTTVAQKASQQVTLYVDSGWWPEIRCFFSRPLSVADSVIIRARVTGYLIEE